METLSIQSLLIGVLVMLAVYLSLSRVIDIGRVSVKRSLALFSAAVGLLTSIWLESYPTLLRDYTGKVVLAGLGVVLALLVFARKSLK
jgi:hypothetical protein